MATGDDLFLSTKAKAIRNKQKKLDVIANDEKKLKDKSFKPDQDFLNKIERRPQLEAEIQDLQAQIDLYIKSNPDYANKNTGPQIGEQEVHDRIVSAFSLVGQMRTIHALLQSDSSYVEISENQRAALSSVHSAFDRMVEATENGEDSFKDQSHISSFAHLFAALATGSESVSSGVPFSELRAFIQTSLSDAELVAKTNQRIANKKMAAEKEEADKKAQAAAQAKIEAEKAAAEEAAKAHAEETKQTKHEEVQKQVEHVEEEETKETPAHEEQNAEEDRDNQDEDRTDKPTDAQRGDRRGGRGGSRGGRRGDDNYRGRGDRQNNQRGGRGRPRTAANEDEDGFVTETGRKPRGDRRGGYRGDR